MLESGVFLGRGRDCICDHGWGTHQVRGPVHFRSEGVKVYADPAEQPMVCGLCECEEYVPARAQWFYGKPNARVICWWEDGKPVCGKKPDEAMIEKVQTTGFWTWSPRKADRCSGCVRWLEKNPQVRDPRVTA